ncbi:MAG: M42 family metallopeptidase [Ruminococcus sp.]|nr:M42 family metallopeptidase [Ruminococcus sp.]
MDILNELKTLCDINGISGDEGRVRDYIISQIKDKCEITVDPLGSVIAFCKGEKRANKKLMISAHMDEVGFIVTYITSDGLIKLAPVGGIDPRIVFGKRVVVGDKGIYGVVGGKALHHLEGEEKSRAVPFDKLYIDIGAQSKEEAEKFVSLGDSICFDNNFITLGENRIKSKAIDDRAGCAVMLDMIRHGVEYDTFFTFVVQEEIGLRGSTAAAFTVAPDYAIVLESTTAADIPASSGDKRVCELDKGAVVSFMDRSTLYDKSLYNLAFEIGEQENIKVQTKTMVAGGNDAGAIHKSRGGVKTAAISVPCRYLHSPSCVISKFDLFSVRALAEKLSKRIQES